jgi:hypothetical protein
VEEVMKNWARHDGERNHIDNLLASIICRYFWLQGHMRMHMNTRDFLSLKGGSLWLRLYYSLPNPVKEPSLEQLVQFMGVNIKMNGESRPSRPSVPITSSSIIYAMAAPDEETHHVCSNSSTTIP